ncbi:hypothetical protein D3C80_1728460 [compost metagenome]
MNSGITHCGTSAHEDFNRTVVQACFGLVRYIVVNIGNRAVGIGNDKNMRNKRCFGIIGKQNSLQRSINNHIFGNIEEYSAVPQRCMQSGNGMLARQHSLVQITLNKIAMLFGRSLQIGKDYPLCSQLRRQPSVDHT